MNNGKTVLMETVDHVTWLTLNRPQSMNSLNFDLIRDLNHCIDLIESTTETRVIVIAGVGRAFCSGVDLSYALKQAESGWGSVASLLKDVSKTFDRIANSAIPCIAAVNGFAIAGGLELILCCDLVVATESSTFGDGHANYGLLPGGGATVRLSKKIGLSRAKEMLFTANIYSASEMKDFGLVNVVTSDSDLEKDTQDLASNISKKSGSCIRHMKNLLDNGTQQPIETALKMEHLASEAHSYSSDFHEGLTAFKEKRKPIFNK
jgi:enoyl-CoA hydratase/carnithine racemase